MDTLAPVLGSAAVVSTLLQLLKNAAWFPWISRDTGRLNAVLSVLAAGLTAFGLSFDGHFDDSTGAFTLGFSGTIAGLVDGLAHWIGQWATQHAFYKGFIAPAEILGETRAVLKMALLGELPQIKKNVPPQTSSLNSAGTTSGTGGV